MARRTIYRPKIKNLFAISTAQNKRKLRCVDEIIEYAVKHSCRVWKQR